MDYAISLSEIIIVILTLIGTGLGYIIKEQREKLKQVRAQLSDKKYNLYYSVYSIFFDLIKGKNSKNVKQIGQKIVDVKKDLMLYAPDNVVFKFLEWNRFISNNDNDVRHAKIFLELFIDIRKDMGYKKTNLTKKEILGMIMTTDEDVNQFYLLINS